MKNIFFIMCFFISVGVAADPWTGDTKIEWIYPQNGGIGFKTGYSNHELISCDNGGRLLLSSSHPNYQVLASALLAAFMADKTVDVNIDGEGVTSPSCQQTINRLFVKP